MNDIIPSRRTSNRKSRRDARPLVEGLEQRFLLYATTGNRWVYPQRITYSFVPDGTNVGGTPSTLFQTMKAAGTTATWQLAIQKAAAIWEAVANVQLVQVPDNGAAVGGSGNQQGDSHFGDIRIGAIPEQSGVLGLTFFPPPSNGGTLAGDMFFNSNANWQASTGYDVESVALHEMGHALGMNHSQIQQAVMYASYTGVKQSPNSDDISGIDSIYGAVPSDPSSNGQIATATNISGQIKSNGQIALGGQEAFSGTDQNFYQVTVPASTTGTMTVSVQSTSLSSLAPRVTVYNASGQGLVQASNPNGFNTTATVSVNDVAPGQVFYIRAIAANTGAGSIGAYGLLVNFGSQAQARIAPPVTTVASKSNSTTGTSGSETTGRSGGGLLGGLVGGLLGGVLDIVGTVLDDVIHIGSLTGAGDALTISPGYAAKHHLTPVKGRHPFLKLIHGKVHPHPGPLAVKPKETPHVAAHHALHAHSSH